MFITAFTTAPPTCPYPEPVRSSPYPHIPLLVDLSYYYPPIQAWFSQVVSFPTKIPYTPRLSPIRATCPSNLILLYFITRTILGEQCRLLSCSLFSDGNKFKIITNLMYLSIKLPPYAMLAVRMLKQGSCLRLAKRDCYALEDTCVINTFSLDLCLLHHY